MHRNVLIPLVHNIGTTRYYMGFLVAQWSRIHLPMQETLVQSWGWEKSPGKGNGNPVQYSCLGNPTDRGAWWASVHGVTKESDMT